MNALSPPPHRFTSAEFARLARSGGLGGLRLELRRGMLVEVSPQYVPHAVLKVAVYDAFKAALQSFSPKWRVLSEVSVDFAEGFQPIPDIVIYDPARIAGPLDGPLPGAAVVLVVEVASTSLADDLGEKLEDYAAAGLAEYWVADLKAGRMLRHDGPGPEGYARRLETPLTERLDCLTRPGLSLPASTLG